MFRSTYTTAPIRRPAQLWLKSRLGIDVGEAILRESALSYLGLGIQPPDASWGNMLSNAQSFFTRAPWLVYAPGGVIAATVWCLFTLGDGLRDGLDPRHLR